MMKFIDLGKYFRTYPFYNGTFFVLYFKEEKKVWSFVDKDRVVHDDSIYKEILFLVEEYACVKTMEDKILFIDTKNGLLLLEDEEGSFFESVFEKIFQKQEEILLIQKSDLLCIVDFKNLKIYFDPCKEGKIKNEKEKISFNKQIKISVLERNGKKIIINIEGQIEKLDSRDKEVKIDI